MSRGAPIHHRTGRSLLLLIVVGLLACGGEDLPTVAVDTSDQPPLDTETRSEPDVAWDIGLVARDIHWNYNVALEQGRFLSIIGSLRITFANTNPLRDVETGLLIRLVGADGFRHVPEVPFRRITVAAEDTLRLRENFIVEMNDRSMANGVERMTISLF